jgi:ABC-2 type transport system ATP-binding protein
MVLRASVLVKRFGPVTAVDGLSFEVRRGEVLGFLGPNGAGKTTTLRMLCGLLAPDAGSIEFDGHRLLPGKSACARGIGLAPQSIVIWEVLTCREQLELMGRLYDLTAATASRRADELLAAFGLEEKRNALGRTLSGGLRRLNRAGPTYEPTVVFLDEPHYFDPQSRSSGEASAGWRTGHRRGHHLRHGGGGRCRTGLHHRLRRLLVLDTGGDQGQLGEAMFRDRVG